MRHIYQLSNHDLKECYIGTTSLEHIQDRIAQHPDAKAISHWDFSQHKITWQKLHDKSEFSSEDAAITKAHELEIQKGCINTGGK